MPVFILVAATVAVLVLLLYVVIRLNDLEKEVNTLIAQVMRHYESR